MVRLLVAVVALAMTTHVRAQQCVPQTVACESRTFARLDDSACRYSDNADWTYGAYGIDAVSGDVLDIRLESVVLHPYVRVIRESDGQVIAENTGLTIARVLVNVSHSGRYRIITSGATATRTGLYTLTVTCSRVCRAPFVANPIAVHNIEAGGRATITANADGTPLLRYRWYDLANPSVTVGTNATITTPPLFADTSYWVEVSNACGSSTMFTAFVDVSSAGRRRATAK